ncbi:ribosomal-processing cysteine protease Prp [Paenibacillus sp. FA6]|uniref:ribosomal-processing cysteine protease Prp n=1 Tax=Paenibacillus sp. FA6 TaxID=3413029 RepID=UPI003F657C9C
MIIVRIFRNHSGLIQRFKIKGHADYAKAGEDIVCAGVSAVTVGTVNSIEALTGIILDCEMHDGFLSGKIPLHEDISTGSNVQLLMESMIVMLNNIAESYGEYIQIEEIII